MGIEMIKKSIIMFMGLFYIFAGVNHFINPEFYKPLIPDYLPWNDILNVISGLLESVFGMGILCKKTRKISSYGIITLLFLFIPSHIYFIQIGACIPNGLCVPMWIAWVRLIIIHPILIYWAYYVSKSNNF